MPLITTLKTGFSRLLSALVMTASLLPLDPSLGAEGKPAKEMFGAITLPTKGLASPHGFYAKGCLAGGVAIPTDGPTWQAMRLSRNRRWGHPNMIALIEKLSKDAAQYDGWPGLLLGDISQPRGGPMITGHASHQIGLDADIWLTPMPPRTLSAREREDISATSMLDTKKFLTVDPNVWSASRARLLMRAASYPEVQRIFVNPAIKKKLCDTWTGDRTAMGKIRPYYGHDYHFHIRIKCPKGSTDCTPQAAIGPGDGCDKSLAWWFTQEPWAKPDAKPDAKPVKPKQIQLADLPKACAVVLDGKPVASEAAATFGGAAISASASDVPEVLPDDMSVADVIQSDGGDIPLNKIPVPLNRPSN